MMQLAKKVPFENPDVLMAVRGLYILSNLIILAINLYTQAKISSKKGMLMFGGVAWPLNPYLWRSVTNKDCFIRHDHAQVR